MTRAWQTPSMFSTLHRIGMKASFPALFSVAIACTSLAAGAEPIELSRQQAAYDEEIQKAYKSQKAAHRNKTKLSGVAKVSFDLAVSGNVSAVRIAKTSGIAGVDHEALAFVSSLKLPRRPANIDSNVLTVTATVRINLPERENSLTLFASDDERAIYLRAVDTKLAQIGFEKLQMEKSYQLVVVISVDKDGVVQSVEIKASSGDKAIDRKVAKVLNKQLLLERPSSLGSEVITIELPLGVIGSRHNRIRSDAAVSPARNRPGALSVAEKDALLSAINAQIGPCWRIPVAAKGETLPTVTVTWKLKRDGRLDGELGYDALPLDLAAHKMFEAASRAIKVCQPYNLPLGLYEDWKSITWTFNPSPGR